MNYGSKLQLELNTIFLTGVN